MNKLQNVHTKKNYISYTTCNREKKYPIKREIELWLFSLYAKKKKIAQNSLFNGFDPIEIDSEGHFPNFIVASLSRMNRIISRKSEKQEKKQDPFGKRWRAPERFVPLLPKGAAG